MPRKSANQAAKKDTGAADAKTEGGAPRRSGRAVTKQEPSTGRDATRSRRSSTAAQTAASVADSRSPKSRNSVSSRRDSTSPSDTPRVRSGKEGGLETPATRVKSTRRNAGRVNYKESDGEEEVSTPKNDDNFDSNEEFEDSDSDEKSKSKGKGKAVKLPPKGRSAKDHSKVVGGRSRRGRPTKKKSYDDEDSDGDVSEDSVEIDSAKSGRKKAKSPPAKDSETSTRRGRKAKVTAEAPKDKNKPSRRSSRAAVSKDDVPKKRPSRSLQAKRYTEEDDEEEDDDVEELSDSKAEEDDYENKPVSEGSRKRKRGTISEPNKRKKEEPTSENEESKQEDEDDEEEEEEDDDSDKKPDTDSVDEKKKSSDKASDGKDDKMEKDDEEPMDVDESDSVTASGKQPKNEKESIDNKMEGPDFVEKKADNKSEQRTIGLKETIATPAKGSIDSSENMDESASDSDQGSRADHSLSSGLEDSQESQEAKKENKAKVHQTANCEPAKKQLETDSASQSSESLGKTDDNSKESKSSQPAENQGSNTVVKPGDTSATESAKLDSNKDVSSEPNVNLSSSVGSSPSSNILHSKEQNSDASINGAERTATISNTTHVIHPASSVIFEHKENPAPKANGAHDGLHNNATLSDDQHYPYPGRKYIVNSKLSENVRKSLKDKTFSFLSYNLGASSSDVFLQKDKLLHELDKLQSQIICLQQVAKPFFNDMLEPSLDALGFKGVFSQPEESSKGMATFYKSTLFRLSCLSEASLKKFIEKDLEASSMDSSDKVAVKTHLKKCGNVLFTRFNSIIDDHALTVANVQIPPSDLSIHALQVSCLAREVVTMVGGANKPLLLCGEFNMVEGEAPYQLLRDGYLSNDMIEELQRRKDVVLPGKENAALVNLLWKAFQHPSSNLCSCYASVLDRELFIPEKKTTSPDLLWYSSDSLHTVGVLDAVSDKPGDCRFSLKADIAFSV